MTWQPGHAWVGHAHLGTEQSEVGELKGQEGAERSSAEATAGGAESTVIEAKVVFCDNGRFVWESGVNRKVDLAALRGGASDGHYTLYWGATGSTPVVVIPRPPPAQWAEEVEGVIMEEADGTGGQRSQTRSESEGAETTATIDESGEEAQVWDGERQVIKLVKAVVDSPSVK